jgi:hypothetical protein
VPNWSDSSDIAKWIKAHPDTEVVERRKPSEKPKPQLKLKDLKPAPKVNAWRRNLEEAKTPPRRIGPEVESSYEVFDRDPDRETPWQRKEDLPNPQGGYRTGMEEITPYTNYQALPEFVTKQRRNPAGGYAGIREAKGFVGTESPTVGFGSASPAWNYHGQSPNDAAPSYFEADTYYDPKARAAEPYFNNIDPSTVIPMENPPWGTGPTSVQLDYMRPDWRPEYNLWRRIRDADIVPYGQNVPLGQQMHPSFGPQPYSDYFNLSKYGFTEA